MQPEETFAMELAAKRERILAERIGEQHSDGTPHPMGVLGSNERRNFLRRGGETPTEPGNE